METYREIVIGINLSTSYKKYIHINYKGEWHNENGPALVCMDGRVLYQSYYLYDAHCTEKVWKNKTEGQSWKVIK